MRTQLRYLLFFTLALSVLGSFAYQPASSSEAKPATNAVTILISDELRGWYEGCG